MASLAQTKDKLYALKDTTNSLIETCKDDTFGIFESISADLSSFKDAVLELLLVVYKPEYSKRSDTSLLNNEINFVVSAAQDDFTALSSLVRSVTRLGLSSTTARSLSPTCRSSLNDIADRIHGRAKSLRHVIDFVAGREQWSELAPKPPKTPPTKNTSLKVDPKNVSFSSSAVSVASGSSSGRSAPPSPYKTTVEEVPDAGEDEEDHGVTQYHVWPTQFTPPSSSRSNQTGPSKSSSQELPKVVLRAPTDPSGLEESVKELSFDGTPRQGFSPGAKEDVNANDPFGAWSAVSPRPPKSSDSDLPEVNGKSRQRVSSSAAADEADIEIYRLQSEPVLPHAKQNASPSSTYASSRYSSDTRADTPARPQGLGLSPDGRLDPKPSSMNKSRPRASTTSNAEYSRPSFLSDRTPRSPRYYHGSDSFERGRDKLDAGRPSATSPREPTFISPRDSPRTAPSSNHNSPRYAAEHSFQSHSRRGSRSGSGSRSASGSARWRKDSTVAMGGDPHVSLPVVLETGRSTLLDNDPRAGREDLTRRKSNAEQDKGKRASWAAPLARPFLGNSPTVFTSASDKRKSWQPNDDDDDIVDWRGTDFPRGSDFPLFSDSAVSAPQAPPSPNPAVPLRERDGSPTPPNVIVRDLPVTLEDIYRGASLQVRFKRIGPPAPASPLPSSSSERLGYNYADVRGRPRSRSKSEVTEEVLLTVNLPRGLKPGSKLKYVGQGDWLEDPNRSGRAKRGDLWFRLVEKEHNKFERRQLNLHTYIELSMQEALCGGWTRSVTGICGRQVRIGPGDANSGSGSGSTGVPVTPDGQKVVVRGLGMPRYKGKSGDSSDRDRDADRGDMIVQIKVVWPDKLADWQRDLITQALGGRKP